MKNNFIKKTLLLFALSLAIISCDNDDQTGASEQVPSGAVVSYDLDFDNPIIFEEIGGDNVFEYTINLSETQIADVRFYVTQIGGTADADDFEMTELIVIPAGYTSGMGSIMIYGDEVIEGDETIQIQISDQRTANASNTPVVVNVNIIDYVFCTWNLDGVDTYGDGWNGGSVRLTMDGVVTDYAVAADHDNWDIAVTVGATYSWEFISGDWDGEVEYILTAPDGTVYADAYYPAVGEITSGVSECD